MKLFTYATLALVIQVAGADPDGIRGAFARRNNNEAESLQQHRELLRWIAIDECGQKTSDLNAQPFETITLGADLTCASGENGLLVDTDGVFVNFRNSNTLFGNGGLYGIKVDADDVTIMDTEVGGGFLYGIEVTGDVNKLKLNGVSSKNNGVNIFAGMTSAGDFPLIEYKSVVACGATDTSRFDIYYLTAKDVKRRDFKVKGKDKVICDSAANAATTPIKGLCKNSCIPPS